MFKVKVFFKSLNASSIIIISLFIILFIVGVSGYYIVHSLKTYTKYDSLLINKLGQIRGNSQRYVKLKLFGNTEESRAVEKKIDLDFKIIDDIINDYPQTIPNASQIIFHDYLMNLKHQWGKIKRNQGKILIPLSEQFWNLANKITYQMQRIAERKISIISQKITFAILLTLVMILVLIYFVFYTIRIKLEKNSITDSLTNLYNRLFFNEQIKLNIERYKRYAEPFSMMLFDIDNFKMINDTYGHNEGDRVLKEISNLIQKTIRKTDMAFRYGGEEFTILFPKTKLNDAYVIANRIKELVQQNVHVDGQGVTISGSVGEYRGEGVINFIQKLDSKLYEAKRSGKNKILLAN